MLHWFRHRGAHIAGVTLAAHLTSLLSAGIAWGQASAATYEPSTSSSAEGEYSEDSRSSLENHLEGQLAGGQESGAGGTGAVAPGSGVVAQAVPTELEQGGDTVSPSAISLPSGAATLSGMGESFTAQLTTGIAAFNVPLSLPAGRAGMTPSLSLVYASSGGYGLAGVGWSLAGSAAIARQTDRGMPRYDDRADYHAEQDRFSFGGQELVPICTVSDGECAGALDGEVMPTWSEGWQYFRARVEGAFLRFFWSSDHRTWRVQSKAGTNFELGVPLDGSDYGGALERNPAKPDEIYRWHLVRQYDAHGAPDATPPTPVNPIVFRYFPDGGLAHLSDIYYTPPAADPGTNDLSRYAYHVALTYESRPDRNVSYRSGWLLDQRIRLSRVDVTSKPFDAAPSAPRELVRRLHLAYDADTHASLLTSVSLEGRCIGPIAEQPDGTLPLTECPRLPPLSLEYQRVLGTGALLTDSQGFEFERFDADVRLVEASPPHTLGSTSSLSSLIDVNHDGLPDVLVTNPIATGSGHAVYFNRGESDGRLKFGPATPMSIAGVTGVDANVLKLSNPNLSVLDLDGDATADLVHMPRAKRYSVFSPDRHGSSWRWLGREVTTASGQDVKIDLTQDARRTAIMDVDGDGLVDVVLASATEYQTFFALGRYPGGDGQFGHARSTGPETATIVNEPITACIPWSASGVRLGDPDVRVGDLNGDGLPDIVRLRAGQILYWPGRGNGYWGTGERDACLAGSFAQEQHVEMDNAPQFGTVQPGTLQLGDVNGDGLADLVEVRVDAVDVYLNDNGVGFTARHTLTGVPVKPNTENPVRVADINGSGSADLLWGRGHEYRYVDLTGGVRPYLLTRLHSGLGSSTELEYRSSTHQMVEASAKGMPWESVMPLSAPVVVRTTTRDNLETVARPAGRYVTEYTYRDPVFDGRQREFRGFRTAEVRQIGDADSPTSVVRSTHLLGECEVSQNGYDVCSTADRWRDNWREPLKGLPILTETFDEQGVYLSTGHARYELRQLYTGRDGRRVSVALTVGQQALSYDTTAFDGVSSALEFAELEVNLDGIEQTETRLVTRRATAGTVRLESASEYDDYGNPTSSTALGCVSGCSSTDEAITTHATIDRVPGDTSGWLFRPVSSFVTGSVHTAERHRTRQEHDARGDLKHSFATLSGTLPLDRFHESSDPVVLVAPGASGGVSEPIEIEVGSADHDTFGNVVDTRAPLGRCNHVEFDSGYAQFVTEETVFGGEVGTNGCGDREFSTEVTYDRGLGAVLTATNFTGQPARFDYDGFGRLVAETQVDPGQPGVLATLPSATYEYLLPDDSSTTPYSVVVTRTQDGASPSENTYRESIQYVDGLGRTLIALSEADPDAGDGGEYVATGFQEYTAKGQPLRAYESRFWSGVALEFPLSEAPLLGSTSQRYDAFGRVTRAYGLDGKIALRTKHHALNVDRWDAADLESGPHSNSFATVRSDGHGRQVEAVERVRVNGVIEERRLLSEYLPTGELSRVTQRRVGSPDVVRWMRYDSLGRLVLNVEPNTSTGFNPDPSTDPSTIRAWRYAYNDAGDRVGTSDARGCGVNYYYDAAGRLTAEDYSPCLGHHAEYTSPDFATGTGIEVLYRYDLADPEIDAVEDAAERVFDVDTAQLWGRAVSVSDLGAKSLVRYDARGRVTGSARRVVKPGTPSPALDERYAPRWYVKEGLLDAAGRTLEASTGASSAELLGVDGRSVLENEYSQRGLIARTSSSYGILVQSQVVDANGLTRMIEFGDAAGTQRAFSYDGRRRLRSVQTFRSEYELWSNPPGSYGTPAAGEPTQQLLLEDYDFEYDAANNVTRITDWRLPEEWPDSAAPVSRRFEYDDLYRLTRAVYEHTGGADSWSSPFAAENAASSSAEEEARPSPHVDFDQRVLDQRYRYDHLGNVERTTDNEHGFYDRSLGDITHGTVSSGPHQVQSASNRVIAPGSPRKGDLDAVYDGAGNVTDLIVRRDGSCLPAGVSCWQRFHYEWDEIGQLSMAQRWDLKAAGPNERDLNGELSDDPPARVPDVELRYGYTTGGGRVLKTAVDPSNNERHTVYIFVSLELRRTSFEGVGVEADYNLDASTESVLLNGGVVARLVYSEEDLPAQTSGNRHLFLELTDSLGSSSFIIDHGTGDLVEYATYQAYGSTDSDYRPERWSAFREAYRFTGKEEDVEVGLVYFGARYLSLGLGRWMSADPAAVHGLRSLNPYSYVEGRPLSAVDPQGLEPITLGVVLTAALIGAGVGAVSGTAAYIATNSVDFDSWDWWGGLGIAAGIGALAGGAAGAASAGTGALLGVQVGANAAPSFSQAFAMGVAGGAASGATSSAVSGASGMEILKSAAMGAASGGALVGLAGFAGAMSGAPTSGPSDGWGDWEGSLGEAVGTSLGQGAVAYAYQKANGASDGYALYAAGSAGLNGAFAGARGIYDWDNPQGVLAAWFDATNGITGTTLGNVANVTNSLGGFGADYVPHLSARQNRTVFSGGVTFPWATATAFGPVSSGMATPGTVRHETVHMWQSRVLGDAFYANYFTWMAGGAVAGAVYAPFAGENAGAAMRAAAYTNNPFEAQAHFGDKHKAQPGSSLQWFW